MMSCARCVTAACSAFAVVIWSWWISAAVSLFWAIPEICCTCCCALVKCVACSDMISFASATVDVSLRWWSSSALSASATFSFSLRTAGVSHSSCGSCLDDDRFLLGSFDVDLLRGLSSFLIPLGVGVVDLCLPFSLWLVDLVLENLDPLLTSIDGGSSSSGFPGRPRGLALCLIGILLLGETVIGTSA